MSRMNINRQTLRVDQGVEVTDTERLPEPLITNYEWQADAACRGMGLATFFTRPKNETLGDGVRQVASRRSDPEPSRSIATPNPPQRRT